MQGQDIYSAIRFKCEVYNNFYYTLNDIIGEEDGDFMEIGAGCGDSSIQFLELCKLYNRKLIIIDPFESGWDNMPKSYAEPYPYQKFENRVRGYEKFLKIINKSSQDSSIREDLKSYKGKILFSFIDGLQYKDAILNDLEIMHELECKIICVDDFDRINELSQTPIAIEEFLKKHDYYVCTNLERPRQKVYLIKK